MLEKKFEEPILTNLRDIQVATWKFGLIFWWLFHLGSIKPNFNVLMLGCKLSFMTVNTYAIHFPAEKEAGERNLEESILFSHNSTSVGSSISKTES